jgi:DNA-binding response OmpR family regulator
MGQHIVVVDDDEDTLAFVQAVLETEGYSVETSHSDTYLQNVQTHVPDLTLLNIMIPGEIGREFARQVNIRELTHSLRLVLYSPSLTASQAIAGSHVIIFPARPYHLRELLATVQEYTRSPSAALPRRFSRSSKTFTP